MNPGTVFAFLPELFLSISAIFLVVVAAIRSDRSTASTAALAFIFLLVALLTILVTPDIGKTQISSIWATDRFTMTMKFTVIAATLINLFMTDVYFRAENKFRPEYACLMLFSSVGMCLMISARDFMVLYLGLELQALCLYVLTAIHRESLKATEAALKYFSLGAIASGLFLFGVSYIYGVTGETSYQAIGEALRGGGSSTFALVGLAFIFSALAFKVSAVPFHMWTPDVYDGAPTPLTAFFATAPKLAAMAVIVRIAYDPFFDFSSHWQQIAIFISIGSMVLGAIAAIGQTRIKRLFAYSSIGHIGYALVGLASGTEEGIASVVLYLMIYAIMTLGAFAGVMMMRRNEGQVNEISSLNGLFSTRPVTAFFLSILLFSLAGIPPLGGFFAKYQVFVAAMNAQLLPLAVIGVISSVIASYYYLRLVWLMSFNKPSEEPFQQTSAGMQGVLIVAGMAMLIYFANPALLLDVATLASEALRP